MATAFKAEVCKMGCPIRLTMESEGHLCYDGMYIDGSGVQRIILHRVSTHRDGQTHYPPFHVGVGPVRERMRFEIGIDMTQLRIIGFGDNGNTMLLEPV